MTGTSVNPRTTPRHRLRTFGTLALVESQDAILANAGPQRRRLALLAVLAAAGDQGRSRDQLLLLFWPDATQSRARHSLEQLLYAIRSAIDKTVFAGSNPVRLNPEVLSSDIGDFSNALQRGDIEAAVEHYAGPFLDGFYLTDSPEFEQWLDAERRQLERSYSGALERLAERAEGANDHVAAVQWWRKLNETDPVSGKNATGLIRALMNAGDHAAALQHAERYESIVAQELGTSVGPAVTELVAEVRAKSRTQPLAASKSPSPEPGPERHLASARAAAKPLVESASGELGREETPAAETASSADLGPDHRLRRRSALYLLAVAVILAVIATGIWLRGTRGESTPAVSENSIAVLPFANVGGSPEDAPLVDGLSEELIAVLAKIKNLRVTARTSAFAFKGSNAGARLIADSLGVSNILEGSVQKSGSRLRVRVRLVDPRNGSTRWSETYDRELRDVFQVQDEIARAVASELGLRLGSSAGAPVRREPTRNVAAYELYLRGSDRALLRSDSTVLMGIEYLRQAVALDPTFAPAWAELGRMYGAAASTVNPGDRQRYSALADKAVTKALELDDALAVAHATRGVQRMAQFDLQSAERHLKRAIALDPTAALSHERMVSLLLWTGRPREALEHAQRALALDPLSPYAHAEMARALLGNDRCDEALVHLEKVSRLQPPLRRAAVLTALCKARKHLWLEAIATIRPQAYRGGRPTGLLGYLLARSGNREEALRIERTLRERWRQSGSGAFEVALVHAGLSDSDQAFLWLDRSTRDGSLTPGPTDVAVVGTVFEDFWRDPRFARLSERLGLQKR